MIRLLMLVLFFIAPKAEVSQKQISKPSKTADTSQPDKRGTKESPIAVDSHSVFSTDESAEEKRKEDEHEHTDTWVVRLTCAIAFCSGLQIWVYWRQKDIMQKTLVAINAQVTDAKAASDASSITTADTLDALKRQADMIGQQVLHMINVERPFMMIEVRQGALGAHHFYAVNHGKSPAQLVFINPVPEIATPEFGEKMGANPWYGLGFYDENATVYNQPWIPINGERYIGTLDRAVINLWLEKYPELNTGARELLAYGAIKYKSRFSPDVWHSKYCYKKISDGIIMGGPYGWNEYT